LAIDQTRVNRIYHELRKLDLEQFVNCGAVMFRVFLELSVDVFAKRHAISLEVLPKKAPAVGSPPAPPREMKLRAKLKAVADHLEATKACTTAELRGVRALIANREHVLSIDSLNAYVHNEHYSVNSGIILTQIQRLKIDPPPGILVYPDGNQVSPSGGGDARGGTMGRNPSSASH